MDGMTGTCPECAAELAPGARFCPRCGGFAGIAAPGQLPGGQPPVTQQPVTQQGMTQPTQWPGGPGRTVTVSPTPGGAPRPPRAALPAALPAAPAGYPPQAQPPADALRADWGEPTVTRQPAYPQPSGYPQSPEPFQPPQSFPPPQQSPQSFQPFQQAQPQQPQSFQEPPPPARAEPARYQAPLPQDDYPQNGYAPGGYAQHGYAPGSGYRLDDFAPSAFPHDDFAPGGYPQDGFARDGFTQDRYPQEGFAPTEYAPGGFPSRPAIGPAGFEPSPPYPGPSLDGPDGADGPGGAPQGPRQPPRRHDRTGGRRSVPLAVWIVLVVLLAGGAGAVVKLAHPFSHASGQGSTGTASGAATGGAASGSPAASGSGTASRGTPSGTASAATEQQAAAGVAALLSQSAADRTATNSAAIDIASCGPNLKTDPAVFGKAVSSRQALLAKLTALPGHAALPPAVVTDLTNAWQASIAADQAYVKWANDELAKTCVPNDTNDPGEQATVTPNQQATTDKTQFAAAWQPVAAKYGLTKYQPGQL